MEKLVISCGKQVLCGYFCRSSTVTGLADSNDSWSTNVCLVHEDVGADMESYAAGVKSTVNLMHKSCELV